jgi:putative hydrolase of the HAD superfamily
LIIFDLDDTLIDTSGGVSPYKFKICVEALLEAGLPAPSFQEAYQRLLEINSTALRSQDALKRLIEEYRAPSSLYETASPLFTSPLPPDFRVPTTPYAKQILEWLVPRAHLALVTGGHPPFQLEKLKKAGLDGPFFSKIAVPENSVKGPHYEAFVKEFSERPQDVVVCGDRVAMDLEPARQLGLKTIHMRWGRGKLGTSPSWIDHSIGSLDELRKIIL